MTNWKNSIINKNKKIKDVVKNLNNGTTQICLVVDNNKKFIGTITDGDIRRGFLKGYRLKDNIKNIINKKSKFVNLSCSEENALQIMVKNKIKHLPIIKKGKIIGIHLYDNFKKNIKKLNNDFIIFAGGKGTRLLPLTSNLPKPMIKIRKKPILEHLIDKAKSEGFYKFTIIVHHLKEKIIDYFKDGKSLGIKIKYIIEDKPLGTAGGLSLIKGKISDNFIVCNSDIISDLNFQNLLSFHGKNTVATVAVKVLDSKENYGLVKIKKDQIISFDEKPITKKYINSGVYVFNKSLIKNLGKNQKIDMISFLKNLNNKKKIIKAFPIYENWQDLGIKKKIRKYL